MILSQTTTAALPNFYAKCVGYLIGVHAAQCPCCAARGSGSQIKLGEADLARIEGRILSRVSEYSAQAYRCEICHTVYAFEDGIGMSLGRYPQ